MWYNNCFVWNREYCYPDSKVRINKLNIQDADALHIAGREITSLRLAAAKMQPIKGKLDMKHLPVIDAPGSHANPDSCLLYGSSYAIYCIVRR